MTKQTAYGHRAIYFSIYIYNTVVFLCPDLMHTETSVALLRLYTLCAEIIIRNFGVQERGNQLITK